MQGEDIFETRRRTLAIAMRSLHIRREVQHETHKILIT